MNAVVNNTLSAKQFKILTCLEQNKTMMSQRELAAATGLSLGSTNSTVSTLKEAGLIGTAGLTAAGYAALEPYRVKRAIFIAAGFGARMVPITLNTPKPLVRVKGTRIIDTLLDAVLKAGIEEIYIVRGYLGEQFDQLLYKYPMIRFLENPGYNEANNISSALIAKDLLQNAYVFEADLLISNPDIIKKYHYTSDFLAIKKDRTDDWCFEVKNGVITAQKVGGLDCWQMVGISYWNEADGKKLARDIPDVYATPGGKERYWEQVPMHYKKENYKVSIRECTTEDIVEIDSYKELKQIDPLYAD
jgi:CTP:phosphocholine cytidylyltransferase-like protein